MSNVSHSDDEPRVWTIDIRRHSRGHITEYVDGPMTNGAIEVVPAERLQGAVSRVDELERLIREHVDTLHPRDGSRFEGTAEIEAERLYTDAFGEQ